MTRMGALLLALALVGAVVNLLRWLWVEFEEDRQRERMRKDVNANQICWARFQEARKDREQ
jgi:hypothetical protein